MNDNKGKTRKRRVRLGKKLRAMRHSLGLSQGQVADRLKSHYPIISIVENGARNYGIDTLLDMLAVYQSESNSRGTPFVHPLLP